MIRNEPTQKRAQDRLAAIHHATREAIALTGIREFTTADVAELSGCSIGTVYRYYPNKWDLLEAVYPGGHITVSDAEELEDLPIGSIILDNSPFDDDYRKVAADEWVSVEEAGQSTWTGQELLNTRGPAFRIIYTPTQPKVLTAAQREDVARFAIHDEDAA